MKVNVEKEVVDVVINEDGFEGGGPCYECGENYHIVEGDMETAKVANLVYKEVSNNVLGHLAVHLNVNVGLLPNRLVYHLVYNQPVRPAPRCYEHLFSLCHRDGFNPSSPLPLIFLHERS